MIALLIAIALVLLLLRPTRERLEPTSTIKAPTALLYEGYPQYGMKYDDAEQTRIANLVPGLLTRYRPFFIAQLAPGSNWGGDAALETKMKEQLATYVQVTYSGFYAPATAPLTAAQIESMPFLSSITPEAHRDLVVELLKAYFLEQPSESTTGGPPPGSAAAAIEAAAAAAAAAPAAPAGTGTSSSSTTAATAATGTSGTGTAGATTDDSIKVPDMAAVAAGRFAYSDAEVDRIVNLSQTAKTQTQSRAMQLPIEASQREYLLKQQLTGVVGRFYEEVYSTLTRPVQESDLDAFLTRILQPPTDLIPEQRAGLKELLQRYYMGAAASQGPTMEAPKTYAQLNTEYEAKLAEYQTKVTEAIRTNDASALPAIRALNEQISRVLEQMLTSLDPLRQDTSVTRQQREELVAVLAQIEREYGGLKESSTSMEKIRRIREAKSGTPVQDLKLYTLAFAVGCIALFVIAMSKS
jgi:hypothetical protein